MYCAYFQTKSSKTVHSLMPDRRMNAYGVRLKSHFNSVTLTTKLAIRVRSRVAAGLPTGYSGLGGNLTGYCCQQYRPRLDNRGGNGTHRGLCWKQVVPSIPGGDFRRLPTLNKRPFFFFFFTSVV